MSLLDQRLADRVAYAKDRGLDIDPRDTDQEVTELAAEYMRGRSQCITNAAINLAMVRIKIERLCEAQAWLPFDKTVRALLNQQSIYLPEEWNMAKYKGESFLPALLPEGWKLCPVANRGDVNFAHRMFIENSRQEAIFIVSVYNAYPINDLYICRYRQIR